MLWEAMDMRLIYRKANVTVLKQPEIEGKCFNRGRHSKEEL